MFDKNEKYFSFNQFYQYIINILIMNIVYKSYSTVNICITVKTYNYLKTIAFNDKLVSISKYDFKINEISFKSRFQKNRKI